MFVPTSGVFNLHASPVQGIVALQFKDEKVYMIKDENGVFSVTKSNHPAVRDPNWAGKSWKVGGMITDSNILAEFEFAIEKFNNLLPKYYDGPSNGVPVWFDINPR